LVKIATCLFCSENIFAFARNAQLCFCSYILPGAARNIIKKNWQWCMSIQHFVMLKDPFLVGFIVRRRNRKDRIISLQVKTLKIMKHLSGIISANTCHQWYAASGNFINKRENLLLFFTMDRWAFTSSAQCY